ncbi:MAG: cation diffusion facilitator family transporter [Cyanobacteria bacterium P01_H01_bin.74]
MSAQHRHGPNESYQGHNESLTAKQNQKTLLWVLLLTLFYLVLEIAGGVYSGSLALIADGIHMLTDATGILIALFASWLSTQKPPEDATFGYERAGVLAALINGGLILVMAVFIVYESIERFQQAAPVSGETMLAIAFGGLVVNGIAFKLLHPSHDSNMNMRGVYLHVLSDLIGSLGAILAGGLIVFFGWHWADPVMSVVVALLLLRYGLSLLQDSTHILLEASPKSLDAEVVQSALAGVDGVLAVNQFHLSSLNTKKTMLMAHLVVAPQAYRPETVQHAKVLLEKKFQITQTTLQLVLGHKQAVNNQDSA